MIVYPCLEIWQNWTDSNGPDLNNLILNSRLKTSQILYELNQLDIIMTRMTLYT